MHKCNTNEGIQTSNISYLRLISQSLEDQDEFFGTTFHQPRYQR